ncbi:MAG: N-acetylmuramoyl-L-alanine amidase, partial [Rhodothalassiaceae bacterium]
MPGLRIGALLLLWVISLLSAPGHAEPVVSGLRLGENGSQTRFVIDIDTAAEPEIFTLADPYRLVIDLPLVRFETKGQGRGEGRGIVERFRYGRFSDTRSRIVLDLSAPGRLQRFFTLPPQGPNRYRLVFDLEPVTRESFLAGIRRPEKVAAHAPEPVTTRQSTPRAALNGRRIIVVDAGHGGNDPGAPGVAGVPEKKITLEVAREAARQLQATGRYHALLTRDRDVYIGLRERVAFARRHKADLFVSLHADSIKNRRVRGA